MALEVQHLCPDRHQDPPPEGIYLPEDNDRPSARKDTPSHGPKPTASPAQQTLRICSEPKGV